MAVRDLLRRPLGRSVPADTACPLSSVPQGQLTFQPIPGKTRSRPGVTWEHLQQEETPSPPQTAQGAFSLATPSPPSAAILFVARGAEEEARLPAPLSFPADLSSPAP